MTDLHRVLEDELPVDGRLQCDGPGAAHGLGPVTGQPVGQVAQLSAKTRNTSSPPRKATIGPPGVPKARQSPGLGNWGSRQRKNQSRRKIRSRSSAEIAGSVWKPAGIDRARAIGAVAAVRSWGSRVTGDGSQEAAAEPTRYVSIVTLREN
jgi:hypothetical protein